MCLFKYKTGLLSGNPLPVNVLTSPKNSWNLNKNTFILLFHHFGPNWARKSYFQSDLRFQDCLLTRSLPTTSILVVIGRIYRYQFKLNYLKNHRLFALYFFTWLGSTRNFKCSETRMSLIGQVFLDRFSMKYVLV